jgi:hypothetical protein
VPVGGIDAFVCLGISARRLFALGPRRLRARRQHAQEPVHLPLGRVHGSAAPLVTPRPEMPGSYLGWSKRVDLDHGKQ